MLDAETDQLRRAAGGDEAALTRLLELHAPQLRSAMSAEIPARWKSLLSEDDVLQQTFVDVFLGIRSFDPHASGEFRAWLATLARRNLIDAVRMLDAEKRGGGRRPIGQHDYDQSCTALYERLTAGDAPSRAVRHAEARVALEAALGKLAPVQRDVVRLYDLQDRAAEDVAREIGRSVGAMYMLRARAHQRLAELMGRASKFLSDGA
ncbi:MAG: RNA polymerase sigma factor [Phycisphaerae bacterium]